MRAACQLAFCYKLLILFFIFAEGLIATGSPGKKGAYWKEISAGLKTAVFVPRLSTD